MLYILSYFHVQNSTNPKNDSAFELWPNTVHRRPDGQDNVHSQVGLAEALAVEMLCCHVEG